MSFLTTPGTGNFVPLKNTMKSGFSYTMITAIALLGCTQSSAQKIRDVNSDEFTELMKTERNKIILDVRTPEEYEGAHIGGAVNIDINSDDFENRIAKLDTHSTIFVYCLAGSRSANAASIMSGRGFNNIVNLQNGISEWNAKGLPTESGILKPKNPGLTADEFNKMVQNGDTLVLVDFFAQWCAPCKKMKPFINEFQSSYAEFMMVHEINYDENTNLLRELKIGTVPYLRLYKNGVVVWDHPGAVSKEELNAQILKYK